MTLVFEEATLLDCTGRDPQPQMRVQLEEGRILRIGRTDASVMPRDARVIDCAGRFLMPGLLDAHVHLSSTELDEHKEVETPPAVLALRIVKQIEDALDALLRTGRFRTVCARRRRPGLGLQGIEAPRFDSWPATTDKRSLHLADRWPRGPPAADSAPVVSLDVWLVARQHYR